MTTTRTMRRMAAVVAAASVILLAPPGLSRAAERRAERYLTSYFQSDLTDPLYQKRCQEKVTRNWAVPKGLPKAGSKSVVQSAIGRDGKLISALVTMESGSPAWDAAALSAVKKSAPFPPLPKSYAGVQVQVHWHFEVRQAASASRRSASEDRSTARRP